MLRCEVWVQLLLKVVGCRAGMVGGVGEGVGDGKQADAGHRGDQTLEARYQRGVHSVGYQ